MKREAGFSPAMIPRRELPTSSDGLAIKRRSSLLPANLSPLVLIVQTFSILRLSSDVWLPYDGCSGPAHEEKSCQNFSLAFQGPQLARPTACKPHSHYRSM
jgi:hypothetical protein